MVSIGGQDQAIIHAKNKINIISYYVMVKKLDKQTEDSEFLLVAPFLSPNLLNDCCTTMVSELV